MSSSSSSLTETRLVSAQDVADFGIGVLSVARCFGCKGWST